MISERLKCLSSDYLEMWEFLSTMTNIFKMAKYFGIPTYGGAFSLLGAIVMLAMLLIMEIVSIWKLIRTLNGWNLNPNGSVVARLSGSIFYGNALLSLILSWKIISNWKTLVSFWKRSERLELNIPPDRRIRGRVIFVSSYVAICAAVEHALSMVSGTGHDCPPEEFFERYILSSHGFLLQRSEYSLWVAIPIFTLSKLATVLWNFQDLIIILISLGLTSEYSRLNLFVQRVVVFETKMKYHNRVISLPLRVKIWRNLRQAYVQQAELVRKVDQELGGLILLSNLNNLFFICLQLFLGISVTKGSDINRIYYYFSLAWLLYRASGVVLAASDINIHSKRALPHLYSCVSGAYNIEIKRLKTQLENDDIALSGLGFFYLYRQKLLEVAAAVVKYELILLQFDKH
ncbi:gustatory receptor for sugar taste 64a-like [Zerene cesonia]|uniref:gustatory receptor for sugar taste 64a-like n=1 Tax=Zerene cesonia TaxID=33412 RepID=UPI0018E513B6|nr:gustatory receptor for sugar taste 64a-like [Zerene cesonia]